MHPAQPASPLHTDDMSWIPTGGGKYEPAGNIDAWQAIGDQPCIVHIKVVGTVEYLDESGAVIGVANSATQRAAYLTWCQETGTRPAAQLRH
jgi:2,4'-dihydroxyacetophenone dioxygenase